MVVGAFGYGGRGQPLVGYTPMVGDGGEEVPAEETERASTLGGGSCRDFTPRLRDGETIVLVQESSPAPSRCKFMDLWRSLIIIPELSEKAKSRGELHWVEVWDLLVVFVLFVLSYWGPFEMALLAEGPYRNWCTFMNHFWDVCFSLDMVLQFFVAHRTDAEEQFTDPWECEPLSILKRYCGLPFSEHGMAGWFWVDAISVSPGWVDVVRRLALGKADEGWLNELRLLRILRLFLRLPKVAMFIDRVQAQRGTPYFYMDFARTLFVTSVATHWFACVWLLLASRTLHGEPDSSHRTWLSAFVASKGDPCHPNVQSDPLCAYWLACYWSAMTLTTVGYGDVLPQVQAEYLVCAVLMLVSGYVWAFLVGEVVSLLSTMDPHTNKFKRTMDDLTSLMESRRIPQDVAVRVRRYMHEGRYVERERDQEKLLEHTISPGLQRQVVEHSANSNLLGSIDWVDDSFGHDARLQLMKAFQPFFFGPDEAIMLGQVVFIICRGIIAVNGRILRRGSSWGQYNVLIETPYLIDVTQPRTLSYVSLMVLHKRDLFAVAKLWPEVDRRIRRAQIGTAVNRAILHAAKEEKAAMKRALTLRRGMTRNSTALRQLSSMSMLSCAHLGSVHAHVRSLGAVSPVQSLSSLEVRMDTHFQHISDYLDDLAKVTRSLEARLESPCCAKQGAKQGATGAGEELPKRTVARFMSAGTWRLTASK